MNKKKELKMFKKACPSEVFDRIKYNKDADRFFPKKKYLNSQLETNVSHEITFAWEMWKIRAIGI